MNSTRSLGQTRFNFRYWLTIWVLHFNDHGNKATTNTYNWLKRQNENRNWEEKDICFAYWRWVLGEVIWGAYKFREGIIEQQPNGGKVLTKDWWEKCFTDKRLVTPKIEMFGEGIPFTRRRPVYALPCSRNVQRLSLIRQLAFKCQICKYFRNRSNDGTRMVPGSDFSIFMI